MLLDELTSYVLGAQMAETYEYRGYKFSIASARARNRDGVMIRSVSGPAHPEGSKCNERHCRGKDWVTVFEEFSSVDEPGRKKERPGLIKKLKAVVNREVDSHVKWGTP